MKRSNQRTVRRIGFHPFTYLFVCAGVFLALPPRQAVAIGPEALIETREAALHVCGMTIARKTGVKATLDTTPIIITFDPKATGSELMIVVRDAQAKEIGKFPLSQSSGDQAPSGDEPETVSIFFTLESGHLHRSYLKAGRYLVPLRLYFKADGSPVPDPGPQDPDQTGESVPPISPIEFQSWIVPPQFFSSSDKKSPTGQNEPLFPVKRQTTVEGFIRSWGLEPPEGTAFLFGMPTGEVGIRSTRKFLKQVDAEIRKRYPEARTK